MGIEQLTIADAREIARLFDGRIASPSHSFVLGQQVFIRTVTHYYTGRIVVVTDSDVGLEDAAWIADTGRFADALRDGIGVKSGEVEPYPSGVRVFVSRGAIVDFCEHRARLPGSQK